MARESRFEPLYEKFDQFINQCLLADRSLLWPEKNIWTIENLKEMKTRLIERVNLDADKSFEGKLQDQMKGAGTELWGLLADLYYVYFLPSEYITLIKKQKDIQWVAQQGG